MHGLILIGAISIVTVIPFIALNMKEGKLFVAELKKMKKGG